jgi:4-alpha-glucanotransferase
MDLQRPEQFADFRLWQGETLERACLFQALRAYFKSETSALSDPAQWPEDYRNFRGPGIAEFAEKQKSLVRYHLWLQWIADNQLREAAVAGEEMAIGIYRDLAVGSGPEGAVVWSHSGLLISGASIGAPPDILNRSGQNWGLPPGHPSTRAIRCTAASLNFCGPICGTPAD